MSSGALIREEFVVLDEPGFVDLQVNGFLGVDFTSATLNEDDLRRACRELIARGTAAFLPTMITSRAEVYARNLPLLARLTTDPEFAGHVLGIHLEGPFVSGEPGAVGAHDPHWVRMPDPGLLSDLLEWGQGSVRMLTLAAELPGADELASLASGMGVAVSIGHSLFTSVDLDRLYAAGARSLTHLGNGLPNLLARHPNPIWDGLADERYTAMIIADGHHLPQSVLRVMAWARRAKRLVVVSDSAPVAGLPPGRYDVLGNRAVLEPSGRLYNPDKDCLVGSSATMLACMNHLASLDIYTLDELLALGYYTPLELIGVSPSSIRPAPDTGLVYDNGRFRLETS
ncbi:MAG: N-acetylglucosamine-6-phosphate deacetylase [Anaerolineae bacterium]